MYCYERQILGGGELVELVPQPTPSDVIVMCRYYSSLKRDACFFKHISLIEFNGIYGDLHYSINPWIKTQQETDSIMQTYVLCKTIKIHMIFIKTIRM